jgi:hypothetical protein
LAQKKPHYSYADFVKACAAGKSKAFVSGGAMKTAERDFKLGTQDKVLSFIAGGGLEKPELANVDIWKNNPKPECPIYIDSYNFFSGVSFGYVAFLHQPATNKWLIKSFKNNDRPDPRNLVFAESLKGLVFDSGGEHE